MERARTRVYPHCCLSASCGKTQCPESCLSLPIKLEFDKWVKENKAIVLDPIWCRTVYTAQN